MINAQKLDYELKQAKIPIHGCSSNGRIDFKPEATQAHRELAGQILLNHNPAWYVEERRKAYPQIADQLDMIYWDRVNGTNLWQEMITAIKAKYLKE